MRDEGPPRKLEAALVFLERTVFGHNQFKTTEIIVAIA
jgi:hypothetical protein